MKAKFVKQHLKESNLELERTTEIPDYDLVDDDELIVQDDFETTIKNSLEVPEYARQEVTFRIKGTDEIVEAIPMAILKDGSYLMRVGNKYHKFNINDIIEV